MRNQRNSWKSKGVLNQINENKYQKRVKYTHNQYNDYVSGMHQIRRKREKCTLSKSTAFLILRMALYLDMLSHFCTGILYHS